MKINKTTELEDGQKVTFQGELSGQELDFVLQLGLNMLMYSDMIPKVTVESFPDPTDGEVH